MFNINSDIFQLYHGENKLHFNVMMTLCAIPTLKQQSANRHVAHHIMRRKVSMCSSRNCLHYLTSQPSRAYYSSIPTSSTVCKLKPATTVDDIPWLHNAVWNIRQWSVYQQSVRTNNDVEGKLFYYLNNISCNISVKFHLYHTYRDTV